MDFFFSLQPEGHRVLIEWPQLLFYYSYYGIYRAENMIEL